MAKFLIGLTVLMLTACGGGGGGGGGMPTPMPPQPPAPQPPMPIDTQGYTVRIAPSPSALNTLSATLPALPAFVRDAEYDGQPALEIVNARAAYGRGATGRGIFVGVIDSYLDLEHVEFTGMPNDTRNDRQIHITTRNGERYFIISGYVNHPGPEAIDDAVIRDYHGTGVTGTIAARRGEASRPNEQRASTLQGEGININIHGIAYESSVLFRSFSGPDEPLRREDGTVILLRDAPQELNNFEKINDIIIAESIRDLIDDGARIVNLSTGVLLEDGESLTREELMQRMPNTLRALNEGRGRTIFVFAAGNFGVNNPVPDLDPQSQFANLRGHVATAVAVNESGNSIAGLSNRCGRAADWCIAAPGENIIVPEEYTYEVRDRSQCTETPDGDLIPDSCPITNFYNTVSGTSLAAPLVVGGLALMMDLFGADNYTPEEFLTRLYRTANKNPPYNNREIYGQGLMDLDAATAPVGAGETFIGANIRAAQRFSLAQSRIYLGPAMGDSLTRALARQRAVFFDELDFAFPIDAAYFAPTASTESALNRLAWLGYSQGRRTTEKRSQVLSLFAGLNKTELTATKAPLPQHSFFALADNALHGGAKVSFGAHHFSSLAFATTPQGDDDPLKKDDDFQLTTTEEADQIYGLGFAYNFTPTFGAIGIQVGMLDESDGLLASQSDGPFALSSGSETIFAGVSGETALGFSWRGFARGLLGWTDASATPYGGLSNMTELVSSSWTLGAYRGDMLAKNDRFSLTISQPLRVERGAVDVHYTISRTRTRDLIAKTTHSSLAPSGRTMDLEAQYQFNLHSRARFIFAAGYVLQPGHSKTATGDARLLARLSFALQ